MRRDTLHMTLAFIGAVSPERLDQLRVSAGRVNGEAFEMRLDRLHYWPHNRIVWAGCSRLPSRQCRLFDVLAVTLGEAGVILDQRVFVPHVTLLRNARDDNLPELAQPIHWRVSDFVLVESILQPSGSSYRVLDRWALQTAPVKKISKGC